MQDDYAANKKQKINNYNCSSDKSNNNVEVISLLDDTDDDEDDDDKKVGAPTSSLDEPDDDIEIMEDVSSSPSLFTSSSSWTATSSSSSLSSGRSTSRGNLKDDRNYGYNNNTSATKQNWENKNKNGILNDDEELLVVATKGQNALADFPHVSICCFFMGCPFWMNCFSSHLMFTLYEYPISTNVVS